MCDCVENWHAEMHRQGNVNCSFQACGQLRVQKVQDGLCGMGEVSKDNC